MLQASSAVFLTRLSSIAVPSNTQPEGRTLKQKKEEEGETEQPKFVHLDSIGHRGLLNPKTKKRNEIHEKLSACLPLQSGSLAKICKQAPRCIRQAEGVIKPHTRTSHMHRLVTGEEHFIGQLSQPEIGPPLGETGRCDVGFNYMGMPRANNTVFFVDTFDPHWCTRKVTISLGKLLRREVDTNPSLLGIKDEESMVEECFRHGLYSFKRCVQRTHAKELDHVITWSFEGVQNAGHPFHKDWRSLGLPLECFSQRLPELETHSILMLTLFRMVLAAYALRHIPAGELSLYAQLWMDNHLDLVEFLFSGGRDGRVPPFRMTDAYLKSTGALMLLYPDNCRHVRAGALMDLSGILIHGNVWREMFMSAKDPLDILLVCLRNKLEPHKCMIRWYDRKVIKSMARDPRLMSLMKDVIHVMVLGNFPIAGTRPCLGARVRIRRFMLKMARWHVKTFSDWIWKYKTTVYYMVREFHHYTTLRQPGLEAEIRESQPRRLHLPMMLQAGDNVRNVISKHLSFPWNMDLRSGECNLLMKQAFQLAEAEYEEHHMDQKQTYSKMVHEDFETMLYRQMRKWWLKMNNKARLIQFHYRAAVIPVNPSDSPFSMEMMEAAKGTNRSTLWMQLDDLENPDEFGIDGLDKLFADKRQTWKKADDIPQAAEMLLGPKTQDMIMQCAIHQPRAVDSAFSPWWLRVMGLSYGAYLWIIQMYHRSQPRNMSDLVVNDALTFLFGYNPTDFVLLYVYLMNRLSRPPVPSSLPFLYLGDDIARNQLEACRRKEGLMPWEPTDLDIIGVRYYCGCGAWAEVVVNDNDERDIHAIGLSDTIFDCVTKIVRCNRQKKQCDDQLRTVNMIGKAVLLQKKWYTLCAKCSSLTPWSDYKNSDLGPDCGCHSQESIDRISDVIQLKSLSSTALLPLARYNTHGLYNGKVGQDVGIHCTFCGKSLDIASRQYNPLWVCVSWKSTCYFLHAFMKDRAPRIAAPDEEVNWSIGGIQPPTPFHHQILTSLSSAIAQEFRMRATHLEIKMLRYIAARYRTYLYQPEHMNRIIATTYNSSTATPNQRVGPRQVFLCRTDYVYATKTATYQSVPECQSVWKYIKAKRSKRARDMLSQSQYTTDIVAITKLYATNGVPQTYFGRKVGTSRRGKSNTDESLLGTDGLISTHALGRKKRRRKRKAKKKQADNEKDVVLQFYVSADGQTAKSRISTPAQPKAMPAWKSSKKRPTKKKKLLTKLRESNKRK